MNNLIPIQEITIGDVLGKGMFGIVYKGKYKNIEVAVKKLLSTDEADYDINLYFSREVEILNSINHPNILKFIGISKMEPNYCLVTEFIQGYNLRQHLQQNPNWIERLRISLEVATALSYLHMNNIIHRDIKTENVLMDKKTKSIKLCDFGFSRSSNETTKAKTFCGSEWFEAPEIMFCIDYDERIDIFSFGVVMCEILSRQAPSSSVFKRETKGFGVPPAEINSRAEPSTPKGYIEIAIKCCESEADSRPTLENVIQNLKVIYKGITGEDYIEAKVDPVMKRSVSHCTLDDVTEFPDESSDLNEPPPLQVMKNVSTSAILTIGRLQSSESGSNTSLNSTKNISQSDHLTWRNFLVEFRSKIKTRDIPKANALKKITIYRNCFEGSSAIDWLMKEKQMERSEAVELAHILMKLNVIRAATAQGAVKGKEFKDSKNSIYRFSEEGIFFRT